MRTAIKIALGLAGFVAGFVVSGSAVLLLIYLFETLVQPSALLETHVWWLTFLIGGFGGMSPDDLDGSGTLKEYREDSESADAVLENSG